MSVIQSIRAKSAASPQKARAGAARDDDDEESENVAPAPDEAVEDAGARPAPPPGMGKLVDRSV